jgi:hypothetical protein
MSLVDVIAKKTTQELWDILLHPRAPLDAVLKYRINQALERRSNDSSVDSPKPASDKGISPTSTLDKQPGVPSSE